MLNIHNLQYQYKNADETYTYNVEVKPTEIVAILGQSGSGKSTLLDILAGFIEPSQGSVTLDGKEILGRPIDERPLSILFQNHNLFEHLSVEKNILLGVHTSPKARKEVLKKVHNILKKVGLEAHAHKLASELSGGQQQRVALARVLMRREPILLLDEPFSGLDDNTRIEMLALVEKITKEQKLHTIMVTHDLDDCERIANHVYKMENAKLVKKLQYNRSIKD